MVVEPLAEYIFKSLISQCPRLIPWVLENKTLVELASYMLRARCGSKMGFYGYTNTISLYCRRLNTDPDQLIADINHSGVPDPARREKHRGFLQHCINELQDMGRSPGRMGGYARQIRTFYRVNGVELPKPKYLPRPRTVSKDRAPTPEELQRVLDVADLQGKVLVSMLALGGFREGTLSLLQYRHVKEDLEKGIVPLHIHIDADETKGEYCDFDTFLSGEADNYLKLYIDERRRGSPPRKDSAGQPARQKIPPEEIHDDSPLIRDSQSPKPRPIVEKQIHKLLHNLYHKAGLGKKNRNGGYELRVHSLRKFFKTQLMALGVGEAYIDYWMGHRTDVYNDIQSKGVEFLRKLYANARLSIRTEANNSKLDLLKQMVRTVGASPDEVKMVLQAFAEPHRIFATPQERDNDEIQAYTTLFVDKITDRLKTQPRFPGPLEIQP